jgi:MAF protein
MKNIYLASDSKARRKLLEVFGLKFKVISSGAVEKTQKGRLSYSGLVRKNAQAKAEAAAKKIESGLIISADTIVVEGKRVFGKPKNLGCARRMLKRLSGKPQWIYSGVCVLDKDNNKISVSSEKTKIYMDTLTDKEIDAYFKVVSPLDKAGSFDIQGKGAFFIRRVEGCFYNVVGLPLRTLYRMLKEMDIRIFNIILVSLCLCVLVSSIAGCSSEYNLVTNKEENYYYSTDQEVQMGKAMVKQVEKEYKLAEDPLMQERVEEIGKKIAAVCDRKEIDYAVKALADNEVNAVSLPGGYVYIFKGLVDKVGNDDELAAVIAHEVAHIVARHSVKKMQAVMGYSVLRILAIPVPEAGSVVGAADTAFTELLMGYSREDELLADQLGARYAKAAGYNPRGMISFLEKLDDVNRRKPLRPKSYFKTHPYVPDRIRVVKQEIGEPINFTDYINVEQKKHGY